MTSFGSSRNLAKRLAKRPRAHARRAHHDGRLSVEKLEDRCLLAWTSQGPAPIINGAVEKVSPQNEVNGAISSVLAHPTDVNTLYIGTVNGGIWRTRNATSTSPNWSPLTDNLPSQSIGAMSFDPDDPSRIVAGYARVSTLGLDGGDLAGLILSEDGGQSWRTVQDPVILDRNITGVAIRGDTIVATGGGQLAIDEAFPDHGGLFRSIDSGATWESIELIQRDPLRPDDPIPFNIFDLAADPTEPDRLYAAVQDTGIFRSDDFGENWFNVTAADQTVGGISQAITTLRAAGIQDGNAAGVIHDNIQLDVASDGRIYAAVLENGQPEYIGYSEGGGSVWIAMDLPQTIETSQATPVGVNPASQGFIHFSITVDPSDPETVYVGGDTQEGTFPDFSTGNSIGAREFTGRLFRGDARILPTRTVTVGMQGGLGAINQTTPSPQWEHLTHSRFVAAIPEGGTANRSAPHAGSHDMVFDLNGNLIEVDDGGIYRRTRPQNNTGDWFSINGNLQATEIHDIAYDTNSNIILAGTQDNSNVQQVAPGARTWETVVLRDQAVPSRVGGNGGDVAVDDTSTANFSYRYSSEQNAVDFKRQLFDANNNLIEQDLLNVQGFGVQFPATTPIELHQLDQKRLVVGGVLESFDRGDTFTLIPGIADAAGQPVLSGQDAIVYGGRRNGVNNLDLLYVGVDDEVFVRFERNEPLELTQAQYPGGIVLDIVADPEDWMTAYAVDLGDIFQTSDMGRSWRRITGNLPSLGAGQLRTLEYIPGAVSDSLVIGTDTGVFIASTTNASRWRRLSTGLPSAIVYDLDYDATDDVLVAGTLGRGAWVLDQASSGGGDGNGGGPTPTLPNSISGVKFDDLNGNGSQDQGEPGISNWSIFIDFNGNATLDANEPSTVTNNSGRYTLSEVPAGTHRVREVPRDGWRQTFPGGSGEHRVSVRSGEAITGINFGNQLLTGNVVGSLFDDVNQNGTRDAGERGVGGLTVFVDVDGDGVLGLGEPLGVSGPNGNYTISKVPEGTFNLLQSPTPGWLETSGPASDGTNPITIRAGEDITGIAFGHLRQFDFGDAPAPYPTLEIENGGFHGLSDDIFLGSFADHEADGTPSAAADGDDASGADEDGVVFITGLHAGQIEDVAVFATNLTVSPGYLHGWIDFNADGDWDDEGEQIIRNQRLNNGANILRFEVPADAAEGASYARFRWGVELNMTPGGRAAAGELEDYIVAIPMEPDTGIMTFDDSFTVQEDSQGNSLDVLANDFSRFADSLSITEVGPTDNGGTVTINSGTSLTYTPAPDFFGTEMFTYSVTDGTGGSGTANVQVTVTGVNDDPTAVDDEFTVGQNSGVNTLDVLGNDLIDPDVGETLAVNSVGSTQSGATVSIGPGATTLLYRPPQDFAGTDTFTYTIRDGNGGVDSATVTVEVVELPDRVRFRLETTDQAGNPITSVGEGGSFVLRGYVSDLREEPLGVFSSYLDVTYQDATLVAPAGAIAVQEPYTNNPSGSAANLGQLDEVGGVDGLDPVGGDEFLLFTLLFAANASGTVTFQSNPADIVPLHAVELFGEADSVRNPEIEFGSTTIQITESGANDDTFVVDEDSVENPLDVLANDTLGGEGAQLSVTNVTAPSNGGTVSIAAETSLVYTPAPDFFGEETFTYSLNDDQGNFDTGNVTVTVSNVNDPPDAVDDAFVVMQGNIREPLDVLANDSFLPDPEEDLTITEVTIPDQGGTAEISIDRKSVLYTPRSTQQGEETFSYTISDGNGGTDQATVTVDVRQGQQQPDQARFVLEVLDTAGTPVNTVNVGGDFFLKVSVEDIREFPEGVFSAYLDVLFDSSLVSVNGDFVFNTDKFPFALSGSVAGDMIDELGAVDGLTAPGAGAVEIVRVPFRANSFGSVTFTGEEADDTPLHDVLFFNTDVPIDPDIIDYGSVTVNVAAAALTFTNFENPLDVSIDGNVSPLDALLVINDIDRFGPRALPSPTPDDLFAALATPAPEHLVDVNADGFASAIDALLIINELMRIAADLAQPRAALSSVVVVDQAFKIDEPISRSTTESPVVNRPPIPHDASNHQLSNAEDGGQRMISAAQTRAMGRRAVQAASIEESMTAIADDVTRFWQEDEVD